MKNEIYRKNLLFYTNNMKDRKIINATGTLTSLGSNIISTNVMNSVTKISGIFVDMEQLSRDVGAYIADKLDVEAAYVTASGSAGIVLSIITAIDKFCKKRNNVHPRTEKRIYIAIQKMQKTEFRELVEYAGASIIDYGNDNLTTEVSLINLLAEFKDKIAAVFHFVLDPMPGSLSLEKVIKIAHSFDIPVIVDAAAELPPKNNLSKFVRMGADAVIFSGGKMLGSFSNSGLLLGREEFINAVSNIGPLHETDGDSNPKIYQGRPMKVSKETLIGTVTSIDEFLDLNEQMWMDNLNKMNKEIVARLNEKTDIATASIVSPKWYHPRPAIIPRVEIKLNKNLSSNELQKRLREKLIYVYIDEGKVYINPQCLKDEDLPILINQVIKELDTMRKLGCD